MHSLTICYKESEKEKGIQVADAIAGAVSREYTSRPAESFYSIISKQAAKEIQII